MKLLRKPHVYRIIVISIMTLMTVSCSKRPDNVLTRNEAVSLMTDLRIARAMFDTGQGSATGFSSKDEAENAVLLKHGISKETYRVTMEWYGSNLDEYEKDNKEITKRLTSRLMKTNPETALKISEENNLWPYPDHLILSPLAASEGVAFSINEPGAEKGSAFEIKAHSGDINTNLSILLGVEYENGDQSITGRSLSGMQQLKVHLQTDTSKIVKRLYGYLRPTYQIKKPMILDSIQLVRLPFDSLEYFHISSQTNIRK